MAARHYILEYSTDNGATWILAVEDEAPGPGKTLAITGLAPGTYAVRLRLTPLTGDPIPVISDMVALQVGSGATILEPVKTTATSVVTLADLAALKDSLLAAVGVTAVAADGQVNAEQVHAEAEAVVTVADLKVLTDELIAAAESEASAEVIQQMAEAVATAAASLATVADNQTGVIVEPVQTSVSAVATIADLQAMLESVLAAAAAHASQADGVVQVEAAQTAADIVASVVDQFSPAVTAPTIPPNFSVDVVGGVLTFTWEPVAGADAYDMYYASTGIANAGTLMNATGPNGSTPWTSFNPIYAGALLSQPGNSLNINVSAGSEFYCRIAARNSAGAGPLSVIKFTGTAVITEPVSQTANVSATVTDVFVPGGTAVIAEPVTQTATCVAGISDVANLHEAPQAAAEAVASVTDAASAAFEDYFSSGTEGWLLQSNNGTLERVNTDSYPAGTWSVYGSAESYYDDEFEEEIAGDFKCVSHSFTLQAGQVIRFWYKATAGEVAFIFNNYSNAGTQVPIIADNTWREAVIVNPITFPSGTVFMWGLTGRTSAGGDFVTGYLDNFSISGS